MNIAKPKMRKLSILDFIAFLASIGMISWIITDFFGGMFIWSITYPFIIVPIVLLFTFSLIETTISLVRIRTQTSKVKIFSHGMVLISFLALSLYHSEIFKSEKLMTAVLSDDLNQLRLTLRKNGNAEIESMGMFGHTKTFHGKFRIDNDLILFSVKPYDSDFIPDTILIDRQQNALFIEKDARGNFQTEKIWLNHFEIEAKK